jgi:hypothetical protein
VIIGGFSFSHRKLPGINVVQQKDIDEKFSSKLFCPLLSDHANYKNIICNGNLLIKYKNKWWIV